MFFKKRRDEVDISDMIPEHNRNLDNELPKSNSLDEFNLENFGKPRHEAEIQPAPPVTDFFSSVPEAPLPIPDEPLFQQKKEDQLPPPVERGAQRSEITRVDVELILSKLENIDHRLRWIEDQLRRRGTI